MNGRRMGIPQFARGGGILGGSSSRHVRMAVMLFLLFTGAPRDSLGSENGAVLILGAHCTDFGCTVSSYGCGFVVGIDEERGTAHVLTARHVVSGFGRIYILANPLSFSFEYADDLEAGDIPRIVTNVLRDMGFAEPTRVRRGAPSEEEAALLGDSLVLHTESWVLTGGDREYAVLPDEGQLKLYHLLVADVIGESDPALDVALLVAHGFPLLGEDPVLYMNALPAIEIGTRVTTYGCECGMGTGISRAQARGTAVHCGRGILRYESILVCPGFSGGPVMVGGRVVAMNLTQDYRTGHGIRARLATAFRDLVDVWIDLRPMSVDLAVESPEGSRDGTVSTSQEFTVTARAHLDPEGQLLAPTAMVHLDVPESYQLRGSPRKTLSVGQEETWIVTSPLEVTVTESFRLHGWDSEARRDSVLLAEIRVNTEEDILVSGTVAEGPEHGDCLCRGDDFDVALKIEQFGQAGYDVRGEISVEVSDLHFDIEGGRSTQPLDLGSPVRWTLRPLDESIGAPISFRVHIDGTDRNGKPIDVKLPAPIAVRIRGGWGVRSYWGIGRLSLLASGGVSEEGAGSDYGSVGETKGELELGTKLRVANLASRGIPVYLSLAGGLGIDDTWAKENEAQAESSKSLVADWRAWWGLGTSVELGPVEVCLDGGQIWFGRHVEDDASNELLEEYSKDTVMSPFIRSGIEVALAPSFSVYAGGRFITDFDSIEYYLQLRLRGGW